MSTTVTLSASSPSSSALASVRGERKEASSSATDSDVGGSRAAEVLADGGRGVRFEMYRPLGLLASLLSEEGDGWIRRVRLREGVTRASAVSAVAGTAAVTGAGLRVAA